MQEKETTIREDLSVVPSEGRIIAIDPGTKRIGVAVCDERRIAVRPLPIVERTSWKKLLIKIRDILTEFDAVGLVVGLPYNFDGTEGEMSSEARKLARNFALSLDIPVFLQDERATTYEARGKLWSRGATDVELAKTLDSEAAAIILSDFLGRASAS